MAEFFRNLRLKKEQIFDNKIPDHIDAILKLLDALNDDPKFENMLSVSERRPKTMCDALERLIQQGRDEAADRIAQLEAEIAELRAKLEEKNKEGGAADMNEYMTNEENFELKDKFVDFKYSFFLHKYWCVAPYPE